MRFTALYAVGALATLAPFVAVACEGTSFSVHDDGGTTVTPNDGSPPTGDDTAETDSSPAEDSSIADAAVKPSCRRSAPFGPPVRVLGLPDNALQLRLLPEDEAEVLQRCVQHHVHRHEAVGRPCVVP